MTDPEDRPADEPPFAPTDQRKEKGLSLTDLQVAILGLGLMGGSLALALRSQCKALRAFDPDPATIRLARARQIVDQASIHLADILPYADLVILAAPVHSILSLIQQLPALHPGSAVVLDIGSTKTRIVQALANLPPRFDPLGGHPICGKETSGLENADPDLYLSAPFVFTPLPHTSSSARNLAVELTGAIGAHAMWLDADTHDRYVATTSHLPYLIAAALTLSAPAETANLTGPGFYSATRLAASSPRMMTDILISNRAQLFNALAHFRHQLDFLEQELLSKSETHIEGLLNQVANRQRDLTLNFRRRSQV